MGVQLIHIVKNLSAIPSETYKRETHDCLPYVASSLFREKLAKIDRTEDVIISPDGKRLAIAAFLFNQIYIFSIDIDDSVDASAPRIELKEGVILASDDLCHPHGMCFVGDNHLIVSNRSGDVTLFAIPELSAELKLVNADPAGIISSRPWYKAKVQTPGSVAVYPMEGDRYRVLINNDNWQFISDHTVSLGDTIRFEHRGVLIEKGLALPDGVAVSLDQQWIAVSNHVDGEVLLFKNSPGLNRNTSATASLQGIVCPHGIDFDASGNLYAADAASPYMHVFKQPATGWGGAQQPSFRIRMVDRETFFRGRYDCYEGGLKGLHINKANDLLVTSFKFGILEFRSLKRLDGNSDPVDEDELQLCVDGRNRYAAGSVITHSRHWTLKDRLRNRLGQLKLKFLERDKDAALQARLKELEQQNKSSNEPLLSSGGPVVSIATHPARIATAYLALESIARGTMKPGRLMLHISGDVKIPASLKRLQERGLEIHWTPDYGPHTKYYPCLESLSSSAELSEPLVTADDDTLYPEDWLSMLWESHESNTSAIHAVEVRRISLNKYHFEPYQDWPVCDSNDSTQLKAFIASGGVIYPCEFLKLMLEQGTSFQEKCPTSDSVWLSYLAHQGSIDILPTDLSATACHKIPGTEKSGLGFDNIGCGGSQIRLAQLYSPEQRAEMYKQQLV